MTILDCRALNLSEFVDDELPGAEMLRVAQHIGRCRECGAEVARIRELGDALRVAAEHQPLAVDFGGLAGGVVSRIGAERSISWTALVERAVDGWRWALVGSGAVAAAFFTTLFVSALLAFGPAPVRDDSLAGLMATQWQPVSSPEGTLYVWANPETERDLVGVLSETLTREGHSIDPHEISVDDRTLAAKLTNRMTNLRNASTFDQNVGAIAMGPVRVRLVTNVGVTAKGI